MRLRYLPLAFLPLLASCDRPQAQATPPTSESATAKPTASAVGHQSIRIVELSGDPATIGRSHAAQLSTPIHYLFDHYLKPYFTSDAQRFLALGAASMFESQLSPDHRAEIHALAQASNLDEREVMLAQCFLDLSPRTACSTITLPAAASPDHVARFARNLDFPGKGVADNQTVLLVFHPKGKYAFASVSWPGLTGVLSGINQHGLCLANMELTRPRRLPAAMPYTLLYRSTLENCKTVEEAITFLESTPRQSANNLMLMDATGDRAVVELSPDAVTVRRAPDDVPLISTNHTRGPSDLTTPGRCKRFDTLLAESTAHFGHLDLPATQTLLSHVGQGDKTLQSMVFEPERLTLHLSTGASAHKGTFQTFDLRPYLLCN